MAPPAAPRWGGTAERNGRTMPLLTPPVPASTPASTLSTQLRRGTLSESGSGGVSAEGGMHEGTNTQLSAPVGTGGSCCVRTGLAGE